MAISTIQQNAFRGSTYFQDAVSAEVMAQALYLLATIPATPTEDQARDINYAKRMVQGRRNPVEFVSPLVSSSTWSLTFDAWATAEAAGDRYAITAGIQSLWPILAESV